ncbi:ArsR/SmtB family transcription factor [Gordonia otitidis]|uniref:Arsenic resistance operon repressor ArsR n=1 Tax=Gordonia otitidis (strain DSM 44809 / CCUG 52243 / JCM 12355 / NBRC 100426 / IFM 10032) TaxID=1108044 RepID=H5TMH0_GORO1|nr:metalloregulator ArsR/SmtB family transcription factor [Gordonia otitidis]GAB34678.1 arsenic resistance operon repressor ArsR [Gordonia otitidis NBRC 100426]
MSIQETSARTDRAVGAEDAARWAGALRALGDPVRLRLLSEVSRSPGGEACVCDISGPFELAQPTISHHLKVLREAGLVSSERRATWVYYRVNSEALEQLSEVLSALSETRGEPRDCGVVE